MWVVELAGSPLITANQRLHWAAAYRMRQQIMDDTILLCRAGSSPMLVTRRKHEQTRESRR